MDPCNCWLYFCCSGVRSDDGDASSVSVLGSDALPKRAAQHKPLHQVSMGVFMKKPDCLCVCVCV